MAEAEDAVTKQTIEELEIEVERLRLKFQHLYEYPSMRDKKQLDAARSRLRRAQKRLAKLRTT